MATDDEARSAELLDLARAQHAAGQYREALATARDVISLPGEPVVRASLVLPFSAASTIAAACLVQLGDPGGALALVRSARVRLASAGDAGVESGIALDVAEGEALTDTAHVDVAIPLLEAAVRAARERVAPTLAHALVVLGVSYIAAGRHTDAGAVSEEAVAIQERTLSALDRARPHITIALAAIALGDLERAGAAYATALEIAQAREERGNEGWAALAGGALALRLGDRAAAEQRLDDAQEIAEELGMMRLVERCRALLRAARASQLP